MNKDSYYITEFLILLLKSFTILLFFGDFLPKVLDNIFYNYFSKNIVYDNSILVNNIIIKNRMIIYNYLIIFDGFLKM